MAVSVGCMLMLVYRVQVFGFRVSYLSHSCGGTHTFFNFLQYESTDKKSRFLTSSSDKWRAIIS